jgi:hypothetical protein
MPTEDEEYGDISLDPERETTEGSVDGKLTRRRLCVYVVNARIESNIIASCSK